MRHLKNVNVANNACHHNDSAVQEQSQALQSEAMQKKAFRKEIKKTTKTMQINTQKR